MSKNSILSYSLLITLLIVNIIGKIIKDIAPKNIPVEYIVNSVEKIDYGYKYITNNNYYFYSDSILYNVGDTLIITNK